MRTSPQEKASSHGRIVTEAARIIRELGPERTTIAEVMAAAGLTTGGFYRHFNSRDALLAAALPAAFEHFAKRIMRHLMTADSGTPLENFASFYLSQQHVDELGSGCPLAALGSDVARSSATLKANFGSGLRQVIAVLTMMAGDERPDQATRDLATLVGAVILARASDADTGSRVIAACLGADRDRLQAGHDATAASQSPPPGAL